MPSGKIHRQISKQRTGKTYEHLHIWIDDNEDDRSVNHRNKNHHYTEELRRYVHDTFGGHEAVSEWLFHIALDNLDTSVTNDWMHKLSDSNIHKFGFNKNGYIHYEESEVDEDELDEEFEKDE